MRHLLCDIPSCRSPKVYAFGLCQRDYLRWRKHGDSAVPNRDPIAVLDEIERFNRRVITPDGCWQWMGADNGLGYGTTTIKYRRYYMHRLSYSRFVGPIPEGLVIDHLCRNPGCFNPEHLEAVTQQENTLRSPLIGQKSHCKYGHEFSEENTYVSPAGARRCVECSRRRSREQRAKRKAMVQ